MACSIDEPHETIANKERMKLKGPWGVILVMSFKGIFGLTIKELNGVLLSSNTMKG